MFNPIAAIIETRENTKEPIPTKIRTTNIIGNNIAYSKGNNSNTDKQQFNLKVLVL